MKRFAALVVEDEGRGLFDQFLVSSLQRTVTLAQMHDISVLIGQNLYFDMARVFDEFFHIHRTVTKSTQCFGRGGKKSIFHFIFTLYFTHTASAAAGCRFNDHRISHLIGKLSCLFNRFNRTVTAGNDRHTRLFHNIFGFGFVAHQLHYFHIGTDKLDIMVFADFNKILIFTQKTVTGENSITPTHFRCRNNSGDIEITLIGSVFAYADRSVGILQIERIFVCLGIDGDRLLPHLFDSTYCSQGYFSPVGNQNFFNSH